MKEPVQVLEELLLQRDTAQQMDAYQKVAEKNAEDAWTAYKNDLKAVVTTGGIQLSKVYIITIKGVKKAVRLMADNGRSDEQKNLRLDVMDMA